MTETKKREFIGYIAKEEQKMLDGINKTLQKGECNLVEFAEAISGASRAITLVLSDALAHHQLKKTITDREYDDVYDMWNYFYDETLPDVMKTVAKVCKCKQTK
jgi:hypothetical protein